MENKIKNDRNIFEALLLIDGEFDNNYDILEDIIPTFSLPIEGIPVLYYTLDFLVKSKIYKIFILTCRHYELARKLVSIYMESISDRFSINVVKILKEQSSVEILRHFESFNITLENPFLLIENCFLTFFDLNKVFSNFNNVLNSNENFTKLCAILYNNNDALATKDSKKKSFKQISMLNENQKKEISKSTEKNEKESDQFESENKEVREKKWLLMNERINLSNKRNDNNNESEKSAKLIKFFEDKKKDINISDLFPNKNKSKKSISVYRNLQLTNIYICDNNIFGLLRENFDYTKISDILENINELEIFQVFITNFVINKKSFYFNLRNFFDYKILLKQIKGKNYYSFNNFVIFDFNENNNYKIKRISNNQNSFFSEKLCPLFSDLVKLKVFNSIQNLSSINFLKNCFEIKNDLKLNFDNKEFEIKNSLLFSNIKMHNKIYIDNSLIMNNCYIGKECIINDGNILFPFTFLPKKTIIPKNSIVFTLFSNLENNFNRNKNLSKFILLDFSSDNKLVCKNNLKSFENIENILNFHIYNYLRIFFEKNKNGSLNVKNSLKLDSHFKNKNFNFKFSKHSLIEFSINSKNLKNNFMVLKFFNELETFSNLFGFSLFNNSYHKNGNKKNNNITHYENDGNKFYLKTFIYILNAEKENLNQLNLKVPSSEPKYIINEIELSNKFYQIKILFLILEKSDFELKKSESLFDGFKDKNNIELKKVIKRYKFIISISEILKNQIFALDKEKEEKKNICMELKTLRISYGLENRDLIVSLFLNILLISIKNSIKLKKIENLENKLKNTLENFEEEIAMEINENVIRIKYIIKSCLGNENIIYCIREINLWAEFLGVYLKYIIESLLNENILEKKDLEIFDENYKLKNEEKFLLIEKEDKLFIEDVKEILDILE